MQRRVVFPHRRRSHEVAELSNKFPDFLGCDGTKWEAPKPAPINHRGRDMKVVLSYVALGSAVLNARFLSLPARHPLVKGYSGGWLRSRIGNAI